jgi:hypothetical protein
LAALQNARQLLPNAQPDLVMNNLIDGLQNAPIFVPPGALPAHVPDKQHVFTTDQERTALMLQREANNSRSIVQFVQSITAITSGADHCVKDLQPAQVEAFTELTELPQ